MVVTEKYIKKSDFPLHVSQKWSERMPSFPLEKVGKRRSFTLIKALTSERALY